MLFVWVAIIAYILFAINGVIDKFLLSKAVRDPIAYAFYIGITAPLVLFLLPFGFQMLSSVTDLLIAILGGGVFVFALYFFYVAIQKTSISRIMPLEGGLVPVFTLVLAYFILGERLGAFQLLAFVFLVSGGVLVVFEKDKFGWHPKALASGVVAAFLFALSFTLTKYIFDQTNFVSGLIWTRLGLLLFSLALLIPKRTREKIFSAPRKVNTENKFLYYGNRITGGLAGFLQNYAIAIGSVTLVNALQGTQYTFLLLMTIILSIYWPKILKEDTHKWVLAQKIFAIVLITIGLTLLTL